jgi:hypothetical protein
MYNSYNTNYNTNYSASDVLVPIYTTQPYNNHDSHLVPVYIDTNPLYAPIQQTTSDESPLVEQHQPEPINQDDSNQKILYRLMGILAVIFLLTLFGVLCFRYFSNLKN